MVCGQTCDGLYRFAFYLVSFGIPLGLYSEIDQIHLSSEAQCVSHHFPLVDCHKPHQPGKEYLTLLIGLYKNRNWNRFLLSWSPGARFQSIGHVRISVGTPFGVHNEKIQNSKIVKKLQIYCVAFRRKFISYCVSFLKLHWKVWYEKGEWTKIRSCLI